MIQDTRYQIQDTRYEIRDTQIHGRLLRSGGNFTTYAFTIILGGPARQAVPFAQSYNLTYPQAKCAHTAPMPPILRCRAPSLSWTRPLSHRMPLLTVVRINICAQFVGILP